MKITERSITPFHFDTIHESVASVASKQTYEQRILNALSEAKKRGLSHLLIYADREHFANLHYFTGYDPRFEESILILASGRNPVLFVGNEGWNYSEIIPINIDKILYQSLSLPGQARDANTFTALQRGFREAGITAKSKIGTVGLKYYLPFESINPDRFIDLPFYIIKALMDIVSSANIVNATDIMIHPEFGLRTILDIDEMAILELAATKSSRSVLNVLKNLKPGITEIEASSYLNIDGDPLVAHPNLNFTLENTRMGLVSPGKATLHFGDVCNIGFGYRSSMVARTAIYAKNNLDVPFKWKDIEKNIFEPYFEILVTWYESLKIGVTGKSIIQKIRNNVPNYDSLGIGLNPGHLIHNEEWTTSIFTEDADYPIRNAMAIQCDIIASPRDYPGVHVEDGLIIANESTRFEFSNKYPENWRRIVARRTFMRETLGIDISDDVMPLSDIQACLFPWLSDLSCVLACDNK